MADFFSDRNPMVRALTRICDIAILSFIWVIASLPIVTIGASTTALYYTTVKVFRRGKGYIFTEFKRSFVENCKQGIVMWLLLLFLFVLCFGNAYLSFYWISAAIGVGLGKTLTGIYLGIALVLYGALVYIFPVLSRFILGKWALFRMALLLSLKHVGQSVLLILITTAAIIGEIYSFFYLPVLVFLIPGAACLLFSYVMEPVLQRYMPEDAWLDDTRTREEIAVEQEEA